MLTIKQFIFNPFQVNTYVLFDETKEAVIVDPGMINQSEHNELVHFLQQSALTVKALFYTHGHFDHICGSSFFQEIPVYGHSADSFLIEQAQESAAIYGLKIKKPLPISHPLIESDLLQIGNQTLTIWHLPGHSPGSLALLHADKQFIISGDVLFKDSIGRTDLPQGNLDLLLHNITTRLFSLPNDTTVFSGHGEQTEIGYEKKNNAFIRFGN